MPEPIYTVKGYLPDIGEGGRPRTATIRRREDSFHHRASGYPGPALLRGRAWREQRRFDGGRRGISGQQYQAAPAALRPPERRADRHGPGGGREARKEGARHRALRRG